jgi:hypothetical protein
VGGSRSTQLSEASINVYSPGYQYLISFSLSLLSASLELVPALIATKPQVDISAE